MLCYANLRRQVVRKRRNAVLVEGKQLVLLAAQWCENDGRRRIRTKSPGRLCGTNRRGGATNGPPNV